MISIDEAIAIIEGQETSAASAELPLSDALGFALSQDISAPFDVPQFDNSMVDGYALCGMSDAYTVVGEVQAGSSSDRTLSPGEAMRIFTGAPVPPGTTAVAMQEISLREGDVLRLADEVGEGSGIRPRGGQLMLGQRVFEKGFCLNPAALGLLGSLGLDRVGVFRKPSISLMVTGNELVSPGRPLQPGEIYESNSFALTGALRSYGFEVTDRRSVPDNRDATRKAIGDALLGCEVLLVSGGISVGDYDFVRASLEANGVEEQFYQVFQKPGKPLYFGRKGEKFVFALPGNPASSLTCLYVYVLPFLQRLSGVKRARLQRIELPIRHDYVNGFNRPTFLKARIENGKVSVMDGQGSSMLWSMAMGNALVYLKEHTSVVAGERVSCLLI